MVTRVEVKPAMASHGNAAGDALRGTARGGRAPMALKDAPRGPPPEPGIGEQCKEMMGSCMESFLDFAAEWFGSVQFAHIPHEELPAKLRKEKEERPRAHHFQVARRPKKKKPPGTAAALSNHRPELHDERHYSVGGDEFTQAPQKFGAWGPNGDEIQVLTSQPEWVQKAHVRLRDLVIEDEESAGIKPEPQRLPIFTVSQCLVAFGFWAYFYYKDGVKFAGLDSMFPNKTDLAIQYDCVDFRHEIWRWWTYQFSHLHFGHIMGNCTLVLLLGIPLEGKEGFLRMFFMFNVGVFGGSCCTWTWDAHTRVVGMSGGCYALIGMHIGDILLNYSETKWALRKLLILCLLFFADTFQSYVLADGGVSNSAHAGGFIAGICIGIVVGENSVAKEWERFMQVGAFIFGMSLAVFALTWYTTQWPPKNIGDEAWCWVRMIRNRTVFRDGADHCVRCAGQDCIDRWSSQLYIARVSQRYCEVNLGGYTITE